MKYPTNDLDRFRRPSFPPVVPENIATGDPTDGSNRRYLSPPSRPSDQDWSLGWTDGRLGHPRGLVREQLGASVRLDVADRVTSESRNLAIIKQKLGRASALRDSLARRAASARQEFDEIRAYCLLHPSRVGIVLGLLFLLFSAGLLLADLPLSMTLVAEGFHLSTHQIIPDGQGGQMEIDINDIFVSPKLVVEYLWQCLALAFGIALAPMFLKVLLDSVVFDGMELRRPERREVVVLAGIAGLLFLMIGVLGHFRAMSHQSNLLAQSQERTAEMTRLLAAFGAGPQNSLPPPSAAASSSSPLLTDAAFVLLTLGLPLIGAVFFSKGWQRASLGLERFQAHLTVWWLDRRHRIVLARAIRLEGERAVEEDQLLPYLQSKEYEGLLVEDRMRSYNHGWERGSRVSETLRHGEGLYQRCKGLLLKRAADRQRAT